MAPSEEERTAAFRGANGKCECASVACSHHRGRCCAVLRYHEWQLVRLVHDKDHQRQHGVAMCPRCASKSIGES